MMHHREHRDVSHQTKLLGVSGQQRVPAFSSRDEGRRHNWQPIATGRVCDVCLTAQPSGEFDDNVACEPHEPFAVSRLRAAVLAKEDHHDLGRLFVIEKKGSLGAAPLRSSQRRG